MDADLLALNREHTSDQSKRLAILYGQLILRIYDFMSLIYRRVLEFARAIYCDNVNVDLIFGRPKQTLDAWISELGEVR